MSTIVELAKRASVSIATVSNVIRGTRRVSPELQERVQNAIREGIPFVITMADGNQYEVTDPYQIALGRTCVMVVDKQDLPHILPLLTMTCINYLKAAE